LLGPGACVTVFNRVLLVGMIGGLFGVGLIVLNRPAMQIAAAPSPVRVERPCLPIGESTAVVIALGQSNVGNYGKGSYAATELVDNFDLDKARCFAATDPLLGTEGSGSSFLTRLGDLIIQSGRFKRAIVVSLAVGGASIADLAALHRLDDLIAKLRKTGIAPTHILFEQGETDAARDTTEAEYLASLTTLVKKFRSAGYDAPFFVAVSTKCDEVHPKNRHAIRSAQAAAVNAELNIRRGPDIDMIGNSGRAYGHCHMNEIGTLAQAALWAAFIRRTAN
jgi:carbohydrate esterase-like sialic acid-specific acetylesterase